MKTIRILIVDDHSMVRRGLRELPTGHPRWQICGEASTAAEAVEQVRALKPDIVIMDLPMPVMNVPDAIREIKNVCPDTGVLMLTVHGARQMLDAAMQAGAPAYVSKSDAESDLIEGLRAVCEEREFFSPGVSKTVLQSDVQRTGNYGSRRGSEMQADLTQRQLGVQNLLVRGQSNKQVASALGISSRTVESHRCQIMNRLNVQSLSELVLYAIRNCLLKP